LVRWHNNSPVEAVMREFPEIAWRPWNFTWSTKKFWKLTSQLLKSGDIVSLASISSFIKELEVKHGIDEPRDWEDFAVWKLGSTMKDHIRSLGGIATVLALVYPGEKWRLKIPAKATVDTQPLNRISTIPAQYWDDKVHRYRFVTQLERKFYTINRQSIERAGGALLNT